MNYEGINKPSNLRDVILIEGKWIGFCDTPKDKLKVKVIKSSLFLV